MGSALTHPTSRHLLRLIHCNDNGCIMKKIIVVLCLVGFFSGCSSYIIRDGSGRIISQGSTSGFLRTITVVEEYKKGIVVKRSISTDSNTKEVLMGLDKFIDTTVNTASKLKP